MLRNIIPNPIRSGICILSPNSSRHPKIWQEHDPIWADSGRVRPFVISTYICYWYWMVRWEKWVGNKDIKSGRIRTNVFSSICLAEGCLLWALEHGGGGGWGWLLFLIRARLGHITPPHLGLIFVADQKKKKGLIFVYIYIYIYVIMTCVLYIVVVVVANVAVVLVLAWVFS